MSHSGGAQALGPEPFHTRVAGWLERAFNPIMVKELRGTLRGARFFIAHLTILSIFAGVLLFVFLAKMASGLGHYGDRAGDPSRIGREVFLWTQLLHLAVVFLVVPSLAATSVTGERERLTHDLLLSTTLTARQIVWGKFTAAMTQTFMIFVSLVPLVGLCFLFGGITVYQILANYAFLFALSALVTAFAINISAGARSTQRAVASAYGLSVLGCLLVSVLGAGFEKSSFITEMAIAYGFLSRGSDLGRGGGIGIFERVMYVHVMPGFAWTALLSLFFIAATNRLKPLFANRSTPMRVFFAVTILSAGALTILTLYHELPPSLASSQTGRAMEEAWHTSDRSVAVMSFAITSLTIALLSALFACEDPFLPPHLQREVAALRGPRRLLRCFWPGATSGAFFSFAFNSIFLGLSFLALVPFSRGFNRGFWSTFPDLVPTAAAFGSALVWAYFTAMYARFLSLTLGSRPVLMRTILVLTCLVLAIFPIVHWVIAGTIERDEHDPYQLHGPVTLALSPAAAIVSSLDLSSGRRNFPALAAGIPIPGLFAIFGVSAGAILRILGNRREARLRAELAEGREGQDSD